MAAALAGRLRAAGDLIENRLAVLAAGILVTLAGSPDDQASRLEAARAVNGPAVQGAPAPTFDLVEVTELSCLEGPEFASNCR